MRRAFLKTAFVLAVFVLGVAFMVPAAWLLGIIMPSNRGVDGHFREIDPLLPSIIALFSCFYAANQIVSRLFHVSRLSDERWSFFSNRRSG